VPGSATDIATPLRAAPAGGDSLTVLHILDHVRNVGNGIVNVTVDLACAQSAAGHRVVIASGGGNYEPLLREYGVEHRLLRREDTLPGRARVLRRLGQIVRGVRPDVVNAHRPYATVGAKLLTTLAPFALVATDHNEFESRGRILKLADVIIAVSEGAASSLASSGVPRERIRVVQNGPLHGARHSLLEGTGAVSLAHPAIVSVAGLVEHKGMFVLLDAFERVAAGDDAVNLYFVGNGPERADLEARVARSRFADRVHIVGFQPNPRLYLRAAEIFVLASYRESFGLAAVEARLAGCAVVVTDTDGLPEAVDQGDAGLVVPVGDCASLAGTLTSLLRAPADLASWRERAGVGLERFTAERMATDTEAVYRRALLTRAKQDSAVCGVRRMGR
jgi:glycosyltransferase involved in cell wall biosynthesis